MLQYNRCEDVPAAKNSHPFSGREYFMSKASYRIQLIHSVGNFTDSIVDFNLQPALVCLADIIFHFFCSNERVIDIRVDISTVVNIDYVGTTLFGLFYRNIFMVKSVFPLPFCVYSMERCDE